MAKEKEVVEEVVEEVKLNKDGFPIGHQLSEAELAEYIAKQKK